MSVDCNNSSILTERRGVTLLEVVLAVSISVGIIPAAIGFYHQAIKVRESLERKIQAVESTRRTMEIITNELRSGIADPGIGMGLQGSSDELTLLSVSLPGPETWAVQTNDEEPIPPTHDLVIVGYRLGMEEDESGDILVAGLERTVQRILTARVTEEEQDIETVLLSPHIMYVNFRYWDNGTWAETWSETALPQAVEVTLGTEPLEEGEDPEDYPYEAFRRVVYIPGSAISTESTGRRGGPEEEEI